jgi:hypothetical protein
MSRISRMAYDEFGRELKDVPVEDRKRYRKAMDDAWGPDFKGERGRFDDSVNDPDELDGIEGSWDEDPRCGN